MNYTTIAATIPISRPFVASLSTHYGAATGFGGYGYGSDNYGSGNGYRRFDGAGQHGASFPMNTLNQQIGGGFRARTRTIQILKMMVHTAIPSLGLHKRQVS